MFQYIDGYYLLNAFKMFLRIMFVFVCFSSIVLLIAPALFNKMSARLQKKYGIQKSLIPWLEGEKMLDQALYNHRILIAVVAIVVSVALFVIIK